MLDILDNGSGLRVLRAGNDLRLFDDGVLGNCYVGTESNSKLVLRTNALNRLTIDESGRVGIGRTDPGTVLDIVDNGSGLRVLRAGNDLRLFGDGVLGNSYVGTESNSGLVLRTNAMNRVTIGADGKVTIGNLNQVVYLSPTGASDGTRINDAIAGLPNEGGIIMLLPRVPGGPDWAINETITNVRSGLAKNGVKLRGYGGTWPPDTPTPPDPFTVPLTLLRWTGPANQPIIKFEFVKRQPTDAESQVQDFEISDLTIDGQNVAGTTGLVLDRVINSRFRNLHVRNTTVGYELTTSSPMDGLDCAWNYFENCSAIFVSKGLVLTRNTMRASNCSHNTFVGFSAQYRGTAATDAGVFLENCDNNAFLRAYIFNRGTQGFGVVVADPHVAGDNYFYHLQPGGGFRINGSANPLMGNEGKNFVVGYDQSNPNQPAPTTDSANPAEMFLAWINSKGEMRGFTVIP